jgi:hypothetical protein
MEEKKLIMKQILKVLLGNAVKLLQITFKCFPDGRAQHGGQSWTAQRCYAASIIQICVYTSNNE